MSTGLEREKGLELRHVLESPHAVTFSPEGHAAIAAMQRDAHERIRVRLEELARQALASGDTDGYRAEASALEADVWRNLAAVYCSILGLGGRVTLEDARNLYVSAPHLTYGVNQSGHDGSWSVNS